MRHDVDREMSRAIIVGPWLYMLLYVPSAVEGAVELFLVGLTVCCGITQSPKQFETSMG